MIDPVLARRFGFGAVMILIAGGLLAADWFGRTSYGLGVMAAFSLVLGLRELFGMLAHVAPVLEPGLACAAALAMVASEVARHEAPAHLAARVPSGDLVVALYAAAFLGLELRKTPSRERLLSIAVTLLGATYIMLLGTFVLRARYLRDIAPGAPATIGHAAILYVIAAGKGTDMFAFFTGRLFGRRKLIPHISPGKTWAGAVGGLAGSVAITCAFSLCSDLGTLFDWTAAIPFGIMIGAATQVGDLVESLIKRSAAVKDSGTLVPEFGGVLDIIDCILFVAPVFYLGILWIA
jgi:phosphatidate cytidylyltransferase